MSTYQISKEAAIGHLTRWFSDKPGAIQISPAEIFKAENRNPRKQTDKKWLSNKLSAMRDHGLFEKHYNKDTKQLVKLTLTQKGLEAVGGNIQEPLVIQPYQQRSEEVTPDTVLRDVRVLRKKMPLWDIVFELRPKGEEDE